MSLPLISRSADLQRLVNEGFDVSVIEGHLVVSQVPYVNQERTVKRGQLVSELTLAGDRTARPSTHVIHFAGEYPCREDGSRIEAIWNASDTRAVADSLFVNHSFSSKPTIGGYDDYYAKITTYVAILGAPVAKIDPEATARVFPLQRDETADPPFRYADTSSSRAGIAARNAVFREHRVAIVGLGGTGSYVLDLVAKTPVAEIHLFDGDRFLQHNAFRAPGAPDCEELGEQPFKVEYFSRVYSRMHSTVVAHPVFIGESCLDDLDQFSFVFLCVDQNEDRNRMVTRLLQRSIPFVDVGMGVELDDDGRIGGILRVSFSAERNDPRPSMTDQQRDANVPYSTNIQIADLNSLNASLAVIRWKRHLGYYRDIEGEAHCTFTIDGNFLANGTV